MILMLMMNQGHNARSLCFRFGVGLEITHLATLLGRILFLIYLECYIPQYIAFLNGDSVLL